MDKIDLFKFDSERFDKLMEDIKKKEQDFRDNSFKTVKKKKSVNPGKLWEKLFEDNLKKEGYIK